VRFLINEAALDGKTLTPEQAAQAIKRMAEDRQGNFYREAIVEQVAGMDLGVESLDAEQNLRLTEVAHGVRSPNTEWLSAAGKVHYEKVQSRIVGLEKNLTATLGLQLTADQQAVFERELRLHALPHALIQWRLSGKFDAEDCIRRGLRDMYFDPRIRANLSTFGWLEKLRYPPTKGSELEAFLVPPFDKE